MYRLVLSCVLVLLALLYYLLRRAVRKFNQDAGLTQSGGGKNLGNRWCRTQSASVCSAGTCGE